MWRSIAESEQRGEPERFASAPRAAEGARIADKFLDDLTGLPARPWFEHTFRSELARSARYGHALSLVVVDVDGFSRLNESRGRATGDYVLLTIADMLQKGVRQSDQIARLSDDEFAVVLPETDAGGADIVAEKIRRAIELYPFDEGIEVTVSVGVSTAVKDDSPDSLLHRGEAAVDTARQRGGNACATSPP